MRYECGSVVPSFKSIQQQEDNKVGNGQNQNFLCQNLEFIFGRKFGDFRILRILEIHMASPKRSVKLKFINCQYFVQPCQRKDQMNYYLYKSYYTIRVIQRHDQRVCSQNYRKNYKSVGKLMSINVFSGLILTQFVSSYHFVILGDF